MENEAFVGGTRTSAEPLTTICAAAIGVDCSAYAPLAAMLHVKNVAAKNVFLAT
jgi:hypothetical protein